MKENKTIGMLRYSGKPGEKALAMAYVANVKGVGFYYFSPNDVIVSEKKLELKNLLMIGGSMK